MRERFRLPGSAIIAISLLGLAALIGVHSDLPLIKEFSTEKILRIGIGGEWKTMNPGLQHTAYGDLVLSNQFDPLVGTYQTGLPSPLGAKSWKISEDYREIVFQIDRAKRFSDGSYLSADDYKRSWESAARLDPKSHNSSLSDVVYQIEGIEDFEKTGTLKGVEAVSPETLRVRFKAPFRMALEYLSGVRYAAFKHSGDGRFIGTGHYVIRELSNSALEMTPNPFNSEAKSFQTIRVSVVPAAILDQAIQDDSIDAWVHGDTAKIKETVLAQNKFDVIPGPDAAHQAITVNGLQGHVFSDPELRRAIQFVIREIVEADIKKNGRKPFLNSDEQIYLPLQPGRLDEREARAIVRSGEKYLDKLRSSTRKHPLVVFYNDQMEWLFKRLVDYGITVSDASRKIPPEEHLRIVYKATDYDLYMNRSFSVTSGDPDGIYHAMGKNGAILSPVSYRERVNVLLESGRQILGQEKLDEHYKAVSRAVLEEVPFIHLGFIKAVWAVSRDRVQVDGMAHRRNEGHLHVFRLK